MNTTKLFTALAAAAMMTACGGGGSDSSAPGQPLPTPTPAPTPAPAPVPGAVPAGVPVMLPAGGPAADVLSTINSQISRCGYAALQPVADFTKAAQAHADYTVKNGYVIGHSQVPGNPGFTGVDHNARILAAGGTQERANVTSEGVGGYGGRGVLSTGLLSAPYHLADLLSGWTEIGVGVVADTQIEALVPGARQGVLVLVYGGPKRDTLRGGDVRTFPCEGSQYVSGQGGPEIPDPAPDLGGRFGNGLVFDTVQTGGISVTSIELRDRATGQLVPVRKVSGANLEGVAWRAAYIPEVILQNTSSYTVDARGTTWPTADRSGTGTSWSRSYSFTTY